MELCSSDASPGILGHAQGALIPLLGNVTSHTLAQTCRECFEAVHDIPPQFDNHAICVKKAACITLDKHSWLPKNTQLRIDAFSVLRNSDLLIHDDTIPWYQCIDSSTKILVPLRGNLDMTFSAPPHIRGHALNLERTHFFVVHSGLVKKYKLTKRGGQILLKTPAILPDNEEIVSVQLCEHSKDRLLVLEPGSLYTLDSKGIWPSPLEAPLCIDTNALGQIALCYHNSVNIINKEGKRVLVHSLQNPVQVQLSSCGRTIHCLDRDGSIQTFWSYTKTSCRQFDARSIFLSGKTLFYIRKDNSVHMVS